MRARYPLDGQVHVLALADRFAYYATTMRSDIAFAADVEDADSAAVYTDISRGADRQLWVLEVHLYHERASAAAGSHAGSTEE